MEIEYSPQTWLQDYHGAVLNESIVRHLSFRILKPFIMEEGIWLWQHAANDAGAQHLQSWSDVRNHTELVLPTGQFCSVWGGMGQCSVHCCKLTTVPQLQSSCSGLGNADTAAITSGWARLSQGWYKQHGFSPENEPHKGSPEVISHKVQESRKP